ncbi:MAG: hypothetical protein WA775_02905 [Psychroserpens sp.]
MKAKHTKQIIIMIILCFGAYNLIRMQATQNAKKPRTAFKIPTHG